MTSFPTLYSKDSSGKTRVWFMQIDGGSHRTLSGVLGGTISESGWTICKGKNTGKKNATTPEQQAEKEVEANYKLKLKEGYFSSEEEITSGPSYFEPMLAKKFGEVPLREEPFPLDHYFVQPKLDGIRCLTKNDMKSRNGRDIVSAPHILEAITENNRRGLQFDGELYNHSLKSDFNSIVSLVKKQKPTLEDLRKSWLSIQYHIYDVFDPSRPHLKFLDRQKLLLEFMGESSTNLSYGIFCVETIPVCNRDEIENLMGKFLEEGYEGLMLRENAPYENKRSKYLQKYKEFSDEECVVEDVQEGLGSWSGKAKRILLSRKNGKKFESGLRATFDEAGAILRDKEKYIGKPATVRYQNLTPDGVPRFGVVTNFWPDGVKE